MGVILRVQKLFYKDTHIGDIVTNLEKSNFPWVGGSFVGNENFEKFRAFFKFYHHPLDENRLSDFDADLYDETNWKIKAVSTSVVDGIFTPYIFEEDGNISFRYYAFDL